MANLEALRVKLGSAVALGANLVKSFVGAAMPRVMEELRTGDVAMDFSDVPNDVDPELKTRSRKSEAHAGFHGHCHCDLRWARVRAACQ